MSTAARPPAIEKEAILSDTSESIVFDPESKAPHRKEPCARDGSRPCDSASADEQVALALFEVWIAARKAA
jgi:hypothetical protein